MRSVATRQSNRSTSAMLADAVAFLRSRGFDLVMVETAGIGQSDSEIVDLVDVPVYVMTSEFGAASQLEKIDMLDLAEIVVINKFDKRGAEDALRDVRKQWRRNHVAFERRRRGDPGLPDGRQPVRRSRGSHGCSRTCAGAIGDAAGRRCRRLGSAARRPSRERPGGGLIPDSRVRYLAEIAEQGRGINAEIEHKATARAHRRSSTTSRPAAALGDGRQRDELQPAPRGGAGGARARRRKRCSTAGTRGSRRSPRRPTATRCVTVRSPARTTAARSASS